MNPNVLDLAPNFSSTLFGISNTMANLAGFIAPQLAMYFIDGNENSLDGWVPVWMTTMIIVSIGIEKLYFINNVDYKF